jgi:toxin ParE1/3/4
VAEVAWRPQALRDLEAIEAYYEEVAPDFAPLFVAGAFETVARLVDFPNAGRVVPEIGDESIRELIYRQYRIIYVVGEDSAEVLTVYHSARQFGGFG